MQHVFIIFPAGETLFLSRAFLFLSFFPRRLSLNSLRTFFMSNDTEGQRCVKGLGKMGVVARHENRSQGRIAGRIAVGES